MTTLLETIKDAKETIEHLFKGDVAAWSLGGSARAKATLEKLEQAIAQEQASQTASTNAPLRNCGNCKHVACHIDKEPCNSCTGPISYWEPKP